MLVFLILDCVVAVLAFVLLRKLRFWTRVLVAIGILAVLVVATLRVLELIGDRPAPDSVIIDVNAL